MTHNGDHSALDELPAAIQIVHKSKYELGGEALARMLSHLKDKKAKDVEWFEPEPDGGVKVSKRAMLPPYGKLASDMKRKDYESNMGLEEGE